MNSKLSIKKITEGDAKYSDGFYTHRYIAVEPAMGIKPIVIKVK